MKRLPTPFVLLEAQRERGAELWFYTCCHPAGHYPNRFIDQPLIKLRVLHWINYRYDLKGYLHWGLNQFDGDDPYTQQGTGKDLPLGDRAIAYPGKERLLGSLRYSSQRDGIEDYEYLWVLEDRLRKLKERIGSDAFWLDPRQRPLEICRRVVGSFYDHTRDPDVLFAARRAVASEIEALSEQPLLVVQTSPPEGSVVPIGPRHVTVRGFVTPGAVVNVAGKAIDEVRESGYFTAVVFLRDDQQSFEVSTTDQGQQYAVTRSFLPGD